MAKSVLVSETFQMAPCFQAPIARAVLFLMHFQLIPLTKQQLMLPIQPTVHGDDAMQDSMQSAADDEFMSEAGFHATTSDPGDPSDLQLRRSVRFRLRPSKGKRIS